MSDDFLNRLNTLVPSKTPDRITQKIELWSVDDIEMNPFQPRENFAEAELEELKQSIDQFGLLQPALARRHPGRENRLQLIVGHRRWEAIRRGANAGAPDDPNRAQWIGKLPVRVIEGVSDLAMLTLAIEENEARHDLNPIERAKSYIKLKEMTDVALKRPTTWPEVEKLTGLSYRHMKRLTDLLTLSPPTVERIAKGEWSERHGRAILGLSDAPNLQQQLVRQMVKESLSGRAADARAKQLREAQPTQSDLALESAVKAEQSQSTGASSGGGFGGSSGASGGSSTPNPGSLGASGGSSGPNVGSSGPSGGSSGGGAPGLTLVPAATQVAAETPSASATRTPPDLDAGERIGEATHRIRSAIQILQEIDLGEKLRGGERYQLDFAAREAKNLIKEIKMLEEELRALEAKHGS